MPVWLAAVPADPYDGRPFRYDRARRLVYALGMNAVDDGGSTNLPSGCLRSRRSDRLAAVTRFDAE